MLVLEPKSSGREFLEHNIPRERVRWRRADVCWALAPVDDPDPPIVLQRSGEPCEISGSLVEVMIRIDQKD
jgi:hypothetical protein